MYLQKLHSSKYELVVYVSKEGQLALKIVKHNNKLNSRLSSYYRNTVLFPEFTHFIHVI